jgi:hypothetical protein
VTSDAASPLANWKIFEDRFPRVAMMARDILAVQAAGVGIEREFSIASNFNLDDRSYSAEVLSALMVCNHFQGEQNRDAKKRYYLEQRVEEITPEDLEAEEEEEDFALSNIMADLATDYISDSNEAEDEECDSEEGNSRETELQLRSRQRRRGQVNHEETEVRLLQRGKRRRFQN